MSNSKTQVTVNFGGLFGLLGIILVILKLGGVAPVAAWSWWLVTMPFWIGFVIFAAALVVFGIVAVLAIILAAIFGR